MTSYRTVATEIENHYAPAREQLETLIDQLRSPEANELDHGGAEELIWSGGQELLRRLMQGYFDQRREQETVKMRVVGADGEPRSHRRKDCARQLETRFGTVVIRRIGYSGRGLDSVYPLDAELNLPPDRYSHGVRKSLIAEAINNSFDESLAQLKRETSAHLPKRQAQELAVKAAADFEDFYARPLEPCTEDEGKEELLVLTFDGKGIVMHPSGLREATRKAAQRGEKKQRTRLSPGEKANRKRMAMVAAVYEVAPYIRTPEQILNPDQCPELPRPRPQNKRVFAQVEAEMANVIEAGFAEALRRDPEQRMRWVVLTDGQDELIRQVEAAADRYKVNITLIQDFVHALEYLWKAGHALHPDAPQAREEWVEERAEALLEGRARDVAIGLRRAATRAQLSPKERKPVDKTANYLEKSQERLRYDIALENGLPIATGVIEGACRYLVKDRMDITGARWGLDRAEAILRLRSLKASGDLNDYLDYHFEQERRRNYPETRMPLLVDEKAA
jgi:hypothetical protein